jgi:hypothetical protein
MDWFIIMKGKRSLDIGYFDNFNNRLNILMIFDGLSNDNEMTWNLNHHQSIVE